MAQLASNWTNHQMRGLGFHTFISPSSFAVQCRRHWYRLSLSVLYQFASLLLTNRSSDIGVNDVPFAYQPIIILHPTLALFISLFLISRSSLAVELWRHILSSFFVRHWLSLCPFSLSVHHHLPFDIWVSDIPLAYQSIIICIWYQYHLRPLADHSVIICRMT